MCSLNRGCTDCCGLQGFSGVTSTSLTSASISGNENGSGSSELGVGVIVGIVIGAVVFIAFLVLVVYCVCFRKKADHHDDRVPTETTVTENPVALIMGSDAQSLQPVVSPDVLPTVEQTAPESEMVQAI